MSLWTLLLTYHWLIAKIACLFVLTSSQSSVGSPLFSWGKEELSAKQVASLFFDSVVRLFRVPSSVLHDRDVCFTA